MTLPRTPWPDRRIAELAARQATMITSAQLAGLGVAVRTVSSAVERGRLHAVHWAVYSLVAPAARPRWSDEWAAILACGPRAVLSHASAAHLHGLELRPPHAVELTIVGADRRRRPGLIVHQTSHLHRHELVRVHGLPVTSIARTVVDLSRSLDDGPLEQLVDRALQKTSRAKLREAAARHRGRPGAARVAWLLDPTRPSADTWSRSEARLRRMVIGAGLPAPEANQPVGPYVADLMWREQRVIVEYDSDLHSGPRARRRDSARHNDLTSWGWDVLHVTWPQLRDHPERVLVWVALALARAGWAATPQL